MPRTDQRTTINQIIHLASGLKPSAILDIVLKLAEVLDSEQLDELMIETEALRVQALLEEASPEPKLPPPEFLVEVEEEGFIEEKYINGCGPYLYRRYRTPDGKQKSQYLGKAKK